jgi:collagen type I alpha
MQAAHVCCAAEMWWSPGSVPVSQAVLQLLRVDRGDSGTEGRKGVTTDDSGEGAILAPAAHTPVATCTPSMAAPSVPGALESAAPALAATMAAAGGASVPLTAAPTGAWGASGALGAAEASGASGALGAVGAAGAWAA